MATDFAHNDSRIAALFTAWKAEYNRHYATPDEEALRFALFRAHVREADRIASRGDIRDSPGLDSDGLPTRFSKFADYSPAEWRQRFPRNGVAGKLASLVAPSSAANAEFQRRLQNVPTPPTSKDWRGRAVTAVEDQGNCGSCWSFTTMGAVEGAWALTPNNTGFVQLSMQQLISCDPEDGGCDGGNPATALDWLAAGSGQRIATLASYPFASADGSRPPCAISGSGVVFAPVKVTGWWLVPSNEYAMSAWLAAYGPIAVAVAASSSAWQTYRGGILSGCSQSPVDHTVLLVGYGVTSRQEAYWIAKNSWGANWGESGYVRIGRGSNECGITYEAVLATVSGGSLAPPPPTSSSSTITAVNAYPGIWIVLIILAVIFVIICAVSLVLGACRKRRAMAAAAEQPGAGQPVALALGPGGTPVIVGHNAAGQPVMYAYAAQPVSGAYPVPPQLGQSYDPDTAAAIAASQAEAQADAEFEEATRKALMESAAEAARTTQGQGQWQAPPRAPTSHATGSSRGISVAVAMDPVAMPTAPSHMAASQSGAALPPAAMRALVASQNRALGLPAVRPPQPPPPSSGFGGGWDPEATR